MSYGGIVKRMKSKVKSFFQKTYPQPPQQTIDAPPPGKVVQAVTKAKLTLSPNSSARALRHRGTMFHAGASMQYNDKKKSWWMTGGGAPYRRQKPDGGVGHEVLTLRLDHVEGKGYQVLAARRNRPGLRATGRFVDGDLRDLMRLIRLSNKRKGFSAYRESEIIRGCVAGMAV